MTPEILQRVVAFMGSSPMLADVMASIYLLAYSAFLRIDEIRKLCCCGIRFTQEGMNVTIHSSKTDQYRQGDSVPITSLSKDIYHVTMLQKYTAMVRINSSSKAFQAITPTRSGKNLRSARVLSYSRI